MRVGLACFALAAAIGTPGLVVGAISSQPNAASYNQIIGPTSIASGSAQPVTPMSPAMRRVANALTSAFGAKGIELHFLPTGPMRYEGFQSGSGRCLVDIALGKGSPPKPFFSECSTGRTVVDAVGITYSPASVKPTVEKALATLR